MAETFLLQKRGCWYRPDAKGYTNSIAEAGFYSEAEAMARAASAEGVHAIRASEVIADMTAEIVSLGRKISLLRSIRDNAQRAK